MASRNYVDISGHNGTPDLKAYRAAGHTDLMLKATEGTGYAWGQMQALAREWHGFGPEYRCGYYHWLYGTFSGAAQFAWFWQHVAPVFRPGDLLMTDFEDVAPARWVSDARHLAVVREFNALCDARAPVLDYAPNWYLAAMPLCIAYFKTRPWWLPSDYSHDPPLNPHGFTVAAHQFTDRANVAGFAGPVDYNAWVNDPAKTGDSMSAAEVAAIKNYIDTKAQDIIAAVTAQVHRDLAGTMQREVADASASGEALKALTAPDGVLARVVDVQRTLANGSAGGVDLGAISEAARAGAAAGINGATITTNNGGSR